MEIYAQAITIMKKKITFISRNEVLDLPQRK